MLLEEGEESEARGVVVEKGEGWEDDPGVSSDAHESVPPPCGKGDREPSPRR